MKKTSNISLLFVLILLLIFIGSMSKYFTYASLICSFLVSIIIASKSIKNGNYNVCIGIIYLLSLQNLFIGCGAHIAGNTDGSLKYMTQIPFMVIGILWFFIQMNLIKQNIIKIKDKKWFYLLVMAIFFSLLINHGSIQSILMNIRNMTVFYMTYEISCFFLDTKEKFELFLNKYNKVLLIMLIAGIILLIGGYPLYNIIGCNEVYIAKGNATSIMGRLSGRFYTKLISKTFTRMGSFYYEPVNLAYLYASGLIVNLFYKSDSIQLKKNKLKNVFIDALGLFLTFGKGGWLIIIAALGFVFLKTILSVLFKRFNYKTIFYLSSIITISLVVSFCVYYYKKIGASSSPHFWGIIRTWNTMKLKPYGYGLGTGGNMSSIFNGTFSSVNFTTSSTWLSTGGESAIMGFMYQIGMQGVLFLALCMLSMVNLSHKKDSLFNHLMEVMPLILLGAGVLQANTFTPQCIVPFMLIQGAYKNISSKKMKEGVL